MRLLLIFVVSVSADLNWWKTALVYQVYPRSFKDSDGDGIGDLKGVTEKLPYLKDTGIDAIWLSPIFLSPMRDVGYDISDYRKIAPEFGTMLDFEMLVRTAKELGLRIILDFVPNHTSNESEWFVRSQKSDPHYKDYYIWADGITKEAEQEMLPPSNWVSHFRKSAWKYSEERGQYYLHQFVIGQPDLNYRNEKVQEEMKEVLRFWLDRGVSGFRVDAVNVLYEADPKNYGGRYPDEPRSDDPSAVPDDYEYLKHIYTRDLDEVYTTIYDWRQVLDEYTSKGEYKFMVTEAYADVEHLMRYYGAEGRNGSVPFNFGLVDKVNKDTNVVEIKAIIDEWMTKMPAGKVASWVNGNHDQPRLASRVGTNRVDAMNMLALILPGIAFTYQGEELGMTDGFISWEDTQDPRACNTDDPVNYWKHSRDPCRSPFHWDGSLNAGFSTSDRTWLPVADNYKEVNLETEITALKSHYQFYRDVAAIRKCDAIQKGRLDVKALTESILVIVRWIPNAEAVVAIMNLSENTGTVDLSNMEMLTVKLKVVASGVDCNGFENNMMLQKYNIDVPGSCSLLLQSNAT